MIRQIGTLFATIFGTLCVFMAGLFVAEWAVKKMSPATHAYGKSLIDKATI